jgi:hypothetical protein
VNPFLLNERKFDFRFFCLISSLEPFAAFIYREGIARFCTQSYIVPNKANLDHPFSHLTNTAINKMSDSNPADFTRLASEVLQEVVAKCPTASNVWDEICHVAMMTLVGVFPSILACLPHNGGAQLRSRIADASIPVITTPQTDRGLMYLRTRNDYPFLGAVQRRKNPKKKKGKKEPKGKKSPETPAVDPEPQAPDPIKADVSGPRERALTQAQRYFHIVGIDIILDAKGHPQLLELNDRPSLQVTAPFEQSLKEGMIAEAFSHLSLDGSSFGANEGSRWQQILPVAPSSGLAAPIRAIMQHQSDLRITKKAVVNSAATQRMMTAGIRQEAHDLCRARYFAQGGNAVALSSDEINEEIC